MASTSSPEPPARQLIVGCDGTNNTLTAGTRDTNVLRLYEHLRQHPAPQRVLYYDPGVGTPDSAPPTDPVDWLERTSERVAGLASGRGVYDNVSEAYRFLMQRYGAASDEIFLFGFSRGAFTVRCVAGMVSLFGILAPEHEALLPTLIRIYFSLPEEGGNWLQKSTRRIHATLSGNRGFGRKELAAQVRADFTSPHGMHASVHFIGVWDTVESVGLPGPLSRSMPSTATVRDKRFRHVRHALALDEKRWTFEPRLYEEPNDIADPQQSLKQRWFPGAHCDVGGSYPVAKSGLSDAALQWMLDEARGCRLNVPPLAASPAQRVLHDALFDSAWWALAGMTLRNMQPTTSKDHVPITVIAAPVGASASVWAGRRPARPLGVALFFGAVFLALSGACQLPGGWHVLDSWSGWSEAADAAAAFAGDQLAVLRCEGLWAALRDGQALPGQPAWAMFWDLGFVVCWGYLLARIASHAFARLAGSRQPGAPQPAWRWLGMAPLVAVGGDVCEDLATLAALALQGLGTDVAALLLIAVVGIAALVKWAGLVACVPLLLVRAWIAMPWVRR